MKTQVFSEVDTQALAYWNSWVEGDEPTQSERKIIIDALARNRAVRDAVICSALSPLAGSEQAGQVNRLTSTTVADCLQNVIEGHVDVDMASRVYELLDVLSEETDDNVLAFVAIASAQTFLDWATLKPTENLNIFRDELIISTTLTLQFAENNGVDKCYLLLMRIVLDAIKNYKYPFEL